MAITTTNVNEALAQLRKAEKPKMVRMHDSEFNRALIDRASFDIFLFSFSAEEHGTKKRPALVLPLNDIMLRIMARKNIALGVDVAELRALPALKRAHELARLAALIPLARTAKAHLALLHVSDKHAARSMLLSLGASTQQAAQARLLH